MGTVEIESCHNGLGMGRACEDEEDTDRGALAVADMAARALAWERVRGAMDKNENVI